MIDDAPRETAEERVVYEMHVAERGFRIVCTGEVDDDMLKAMEAAFNQLSAVWNKEEAK